MALRPVAPQQGASLLATDSKRQDDSKEMLDPEVNLKMAPGDFNPIQRMQMIRFNGAG